MIEKQNQDIDEMLDKLVIANILNTLKEREESEFNPEATIELIEETAQEIDPRLEIRKEEEKRHGNSGAEIPIRVIFAGTLITTFRVCTEKSTDGIIIVGRVDFTKEEIKKTIIESIKRLRRLMK